MRSVVELDIDAPRDRVAALFANPELSTEWMDDVEHYEPVSGEHGAPGSRYRLLPKKGSLVFVASVIARDLPNEVRLRLDAPQASVLVTGRLRALSFERTRLISEETFDGGRSERPIDDTWKRSSVSLNGPRSAFCLQGRPGSDFIAAIRALVDRPVTRGIVSTRPP